MFSAFIREFILPILLFFVLRSLLRGFFSSFRRPAQPPKENRVTLHKDPVCGVYVSADGAIARTTGGETVYFCSPECRDKYRAG